MNDYIGYIKKILNIADLGIKFYLIIFLSLLSTIFDIFSIILIIPITTILFDITSSGFLNDLIVSLENLQIFDNKKNLLIVFLIMFLIKTFLTIFIYSYISKIRLELQAKLRIELINKYHSLDYGIFSKKQSSYYIQNITSGVSRYSNCLMGVLRILSESIVILAIVLYLIFLDSKFISNILPVLILFLLINHFLFRKKLKSLGGLILKASKDIIQIMSDLVKGIKEIKISKKESFFASIFELKAKKLSKNDLIYQIILFAPRHVLELFFIFLIVSFIFINFDTLSSGGTENYIVLLASYLYATLRLLPSISIIAQMTSNINNAIVSTESIHDDLFGQTKDKYIAHQSNKKTKNWDFKKLEFRKVSFYYKPDEIVLNNLNLEIQSSSSTLITGPSGCGKSTTIDLLLGFFKPSSGKILVNESESEIAELRDNTYYTSQNKFLFNQTIFNNIVLDENKSNYKDLNNDEKINFNKSLELSRLDKIIDNKTEGLDFYIGESGNNLSGGQRQRISIARNLYSNRKILIFDEATSELDKNLEQEIISNLINLTKNGKTIIVISHSSSIGKYFNKIYDFKDNLLNEV